MRGTLGLLVAAAIAASSTPPVVAASPPALESEVLCTISDPRLTEISGLVRSIRHPNVVWVHNDSSDAARIYGLDTGTCDVVAEVTLRGVQARDIESIASSIDKKGRALLWIADIGDNRDSWPDVGLYRIREPGKLEETSRKAREYRFTYDDRPHNAETVMVADDRVFVGTWQLAAGGLYDVSEVVDGNSSTVERVDGLGSLITDGAVSPDGRAFVLRDYFDVHVFYGSPPGIKVATLPLPLQPQGEAIDWTSDGLGLLIASENDDRLMRVELPWWVLASLRPPDHLVSSN